PVAGPDFTAIETELRATRGNGVTVLRPQLRTAISPPAESSSPAGVTAWNGRLSTKPGKAWGDGREILVSWTPFITLLWFGGGMMAIGGLIALAGLRGVWPALAAAALTAGGAGFELFVRSDGSGSLPSATTAYARASLVEQRGAFLGQFHRSSHWLIISDSYAARGQTRDAVAILQAATNQHPRDYALWLGLGNALTDHGRGLNPAARLAFARSAELAPTSPAPSYFLGLAKLRSGDPDGALTDWKKVLADAPANASWRPIVEDAVASIEAGDRPADQAGT
ncbi:MAG: hypothetical protein LH610_07190, partial [Sphingomonas bacterium]|nr:hypothetical protein [Sphingomonas bacterium]